MGEGSGTGQAWLDGNAGEHVPLERDLSIGRSPTNALVIAEERASRRHAVVHAQDNGEFWLVDLGSSNGTFLNDRRVQIPTLLKDWDVIRIGERTFVFRHDAAKPVVETPATMSDKTLLDIKTLNCWLLVADIQGFSKLSQAIPEDELATLVGQWLLECKDVVEKNGGAINKYLGDGWLAYWLDTRGVPEKVHDAMAMLKERQQGNLKFRLVLHQGRIAVGGVAAGGEESLLGPEVNFVFRMEKVAGGLQIPCMASEAAAKQLSKLMQFKPVPGRHEVPGFPGNFAFVSF